MLRNMNKIFFSNNAYELGELLAIYIQFQLNLIAGKLQQEETLVDLLQYDAYVIVGSISGRSDGKMN